MSVVVGIALGFIAGVGVTAVMWQRDIDRCGAAITALANENEWARRQWIAVRTLLRMPLVDQPPREGLDS